MSDRNVITNPEVYAAMRRATRVLSEATANFRPVVRERRPSRPTRQELWDGQVAIGRALLGDMDGLRSDLVALPAEQVRSIAEAAALLAREASAVPEEG